MDRLKSRWPLLLLALIPLIPLWRAVFMGETIGPWEQIAASAPWNQAAPDKPWDVLQADGALQFFGWRDLVLESWGKGQLPFWNPYQLAGTPLLANSQSAAFYPPHIALGVLHVPTPLALTLLAWFHLGMAGIGVYLLCRALGAERIGAVVGGASFALSPFMVGWTALPSVISTVCWIPWLLWAIWRMFESPRLGSLLPVAGFTALLVLAGHLQFVAYGFMAAGFLFVYLLIAGGQLAFKPASLTVLGLVLGVMLALPHLLPVLRYSSFSHRSNTPTAEGYEAYVKSAIQPFELAAIPAPNLLGNPSQPSGLVPGLSTYWPATVKLGGHFAESALGFGPVVLFLLAGLPWLKNHRKPALAMALIGAVALLLAIGTPLNKALYFLVPGWSASGSPGRIAGLFALACCVLASLAIRESSEKRPYTKPLILGLVLAIVALQLPLMLNPTPWVPALQADMKRYVAATLFEAAPAAIIALILGAVALIAAFAKRSQPVTVAAAILVPALLYATTLVRTAPASLPKASAPGLERMAAINGQWELLVRTPALYPPNTPTLSRILDLGGYDSLLHRDTVALLREINGQDPAPAANGNMMFIKASASPQGLMDAGVTRVLARQELPAFQNFPFTDADGVRTYTLPGPGVVSVEGQPLPDFSLSYQGIDIPISGQQGQLTARFRKLDGWTATLGGSKLELGDGPWLTVSLPAGAQGTLALRYAPPGLSTGLIASLLSILVLTVIGIIGRKRHRAEP